MRNIALTLLLLLSPSLLYGATIQAVYVDKPPKIDGKVNDATWKQAAVVSELIQREPNTGAPVSEKTTVYICYDKNHLYVAFICYDDPGRITAKEIGRDAVLKNEDKITITLSSAGRRRLWAQIDYEWGDFWTGAANQIELTAGYKISVPIALVMEFERNDVALPEGSFTVNVYRINFDLLFSPRLTLKSFIQYDDESRRLGWQSRFRWILKPGNEILFAWNSLWSDPMDRANPHLRDFTLEQSTTRLKINYNYRL